MQLYAELQFKHIQLREEYSSLQRIEKQRLEDMKYKKEIESKYQSLKVDYYKLQVCEFYVYAIKGKSLLLMSVSHADTRYQFYISIGHFWWYWIGIGFGVRKCLIP